MRSKTCVGAVKWGKSMPIRWTDSSYTEAATHSNGALGLSACVVALSTTWRLTPGGNLKPKLGKKMAKECLRKCRQQMNIMNYETR